MRLLQLSVPCAERDSLLGELDEHDLGYTVTAGAEPQADRVHVQVAVPADAVEHLLDDLESAGYDREVYTASVDAEFATFPTIDTVQDRWAETPNRIAPATLRAKAKSLRRNSRSYLWMMVLSAVVATAGLVIGSPAIVVGSMVIAPIVSPMMTASVGTVRNDRVMLFTSVRQQIVGLAVAMITASLFAFAARRVTAVADPLAVEQLALVTVRLAPTMLAVVVGLAAGAAGAYGLATTGRVTIVGVMIAAALIPTAAAVGLGIAWGDAVLAVGAALLLLITVLMVNIGATLMLLYLGYRPDDVGDGLFSWDSARDAVVVGLSLVAIIGLVAAVGIGSLDQTTFERNVNDATTDVLSSDDYDSLRIRDIAISYDPPDGIADEPVVTVTLARTDGREYADLPGDLEQAVEAETEQEVLVQIRFVDYTRSG